MRLHSFVPVISGDLVVALEACGIRTDINLLFSGTPIDILKRLPPGAAVSLADLKTAIALVTENASACGIRGDVLYEEELQKRDDHDIDDLTCGVNELDALVNGFGDGRVFEISGDRESGKTVRGTRESVVSITMAQVQGRQLLVSQIALRLLAANRNASVLWMDTAGDFSVERTHRMAQQLCGEDSSTVLERLQVSMVINIETAHILLGDLESSLTANYTLMDSRVRLVIIDSLTLLLAPSLSAVSSQGHAIMTTFMQHLRRMARSYYLTFLVVNNTSASPPHNPMSVFRPATRKPALGPSFTFLTDCTVWLARHRDTTDVEAGSSAHIAEIIKSRTTHAGTWCMFKIHNGVLVSAT